MRAWPKDAPLTPQSLERMVLDLGRDYYNFSGPELARLGDRVRAGDMEEVLRVYEKELQVGLGVCSVCVGAALKGDGHADSAEPRQERTHGESDPHPADSGAKDQGQLALGSERNALF